MPRARWMLWAGKGALAVTDQALISGSNFALSIVLARCLGARQYGTYAMAFSLFLLVASAHQALLIEPLWVLAPTRYRRRQAGYLYTVLALHGALGVVVTLAFGVAALAAHALARQSEMAMTLAGLALAAPWILLFWLLRAASYLELSPGPAAGGALLYCVLLLTGLVVVYRRGWLSPFVTFLLMALGSVAVSVVLLRRLHPQAYCEGGRPGCRQVWRDHWAYGRWTLATAGMNWIPQNVFYLFSGAFLGLVQTGALKAVMNLVLPVGHTAAAFSRLLQPYLSGLAGEQGPSATRGPVGRISLLLAGGAFSYWALVSLFYEPIFRFLYAGRFVEYAHLVPWATLSIVFWVGAHVHGWGLRALQAPSSDFAVQCVSAGVAVVVGIPATWMFGLPGVMGTAVLSNLAGLTAATLLFRQRFRRPAEIV